MSLKLLYLNVKDKNAIYPTTLGSSVDNTLARWDGTNAKMLQGSTVVVTDLGEMRLPYTAIAGLTLDNPAFGLPTSVNYERTELTWTSNLGRLRTVKGGTGTARDLVLGSATIGDMISLGNGATWLTLSAGQGASTGTMINVRTNTSLTATSGTINFLLVSPTYNQASGNAANTDFLIARNETAVGSGTQLFAEFRAGTTGVTSIFSFGTTGILTKPGAAIPLITTSSALTDQAGASAGTITNAPSAGNPTKWVLINDNGTSRKIPTWT